MARTKFDSLQIGSEAVKPTNLGNGAKIGTGIQPYSQELASLAALSETGLIIRTGNATHEAAIILGTSGRITVTDGDAVANNPTIDLSTLSDSGTGSFLKISRDSYGRISGTTSVTSTDITSALSYTPENSANKGATNGYAPLVNGLVPLQYLSSTAITDTFVVSDESSMLSLTAQTGDVAVRTDLSKSFILKGSDPSILGNWQELLSPTNAVSSVNSLTGAVVLTTTEITEGSRLYYTDARARSSISVAGGNISYNSSTGTLGLASNLADITVTSTEINHLDGISSNVQSQLDSKLAIANGDLLSGSLTTTTTTSNQTVLSLSSSLYQSAEFVIQIKSGTEFQATKMLVVHDGTSTYNTEYGSVMSSTALATFDTDISGGNLRLLATPVNASTTITVIATVINA